MHDMEAKPHDFPKVIEMVRRQLKCAFDKEPRTLEDFEVGAG